MLCKLLEGFLAFLDSGGLLGTSLSLSSIEGFVDFLEQLFSVHIVNLTIDIGAEILRFNTLPFVLVVLSAVEGELDLLLGELAVLAHRVQTNDILNLLGLIRLDLNFGPTTLIPGILLSIILLFFSLFLLLLVVQLGSFLLKDAISA